MKTGKVIKSAGNWYTVLLDDQTVDCSIKGKFRIQGMRATNPVAIGDIVDIELPSNAERGMITAIHERKNYIVRKATNLSKLVHVIAANIDQAFLVVSLKNPETSTSFIDRFLVTSEAYRIKTRLVFNKIDLYDEQKTDYMNYLIRVYEDAGYDCIRISASQNINIDILRQEFKDKTNVICGQSGVGKSTLVNTIEPGLNLRVKEISQYHLKGQHTTTYSEMFKLKDGGSVIDTPGIKGFGLIDFKKEEITHFFPEMLRRLPECKYYNCTHTHEPDCAVKKAVENNEISITRYNSYWDIIFGEESKYRS